MFLLIVQQILMVTCSFKKLDSPEGGRKETVLLILVQLRISLSLSQLPTRPNVRSGVAIGVIIYLNYNIGIGRDGSW